MGLALADRLYLCRYDPIGAGRVQAHGGFLGLWIFGVPKPNVAPLWSFGYYDSTYLGQAMANCGVSTAKFSSVSFARLVDLGRIVHQPLGRSRWIGLLLEIFPNWSNKFCTEKKIITLAALSQMAFLHIIGSCLDFFLTGSRVLKFFIHLFCYPSWEMKTTSVRGFKFPLVFSCHPLFLARKWKKKWSVMRRREAVAKLWWHTSKKTRGVDWGSFSQLAKKRFRLRWMIFEFTLLI